MIFKLFFGVMTIYTAYAMWPQERKPDESAAVDFVVRTSRLTPADMNYLDNLKFWGNSDKKVVQVAKGQDPNVFVKLVRFNRKYNKLSIRAKQFIDKVYKTAIEHIRSFYYEGYYKPALLSKAVKVVRGFKKLGFELRKELKKAFPDIDRKAPKA